MVHKGIRKENIKIIVLTGSVWVIYIFMVFLIKSLERDYKERQAAKKRMIEIMTDVNNINKNRTDSYSKEWLPPDSIKN